MSSIPASLFAAVTPSVENAGGNAVNVVGLVLTNSTRVPIGTVQSFPGDTEVEDFFGPGKQANFAGVYFGGYIGATAQPGALLYAQYPANAVAAYLRGGPVGATLTLAQLQALSGSLTVVMDGYSHVISSINFAADNSFSAVAAAIQAAFTDPSEASFTASIGCTFTGSGSGTTLTVSAVAYGYLSPGDTISGAGVPSGTKIVSQNSGGTPGGDGTYVTSQATTASTASLTAASSVLDVASGVTGVITDGLLVAGSGVTGSPNILGQISGTPGGIGLYQLSGAQQTVVPPEAMTSTATAPLVTYDSQSEAFVITSGITGAGSTAAFATGSLAASLQLTSATGAVLSQGAAATTPSAFMTALLGVTTNFVTFTTDFDPDGGNGNTQKQAFAAWNTEQDDEFAYVCWDSDITPTESVPATGSLGYILAQNGNSGTCLIYEPSDLNLAAFAMGMAASINFNQPNGRITAAFKGQSGITASVTTGAAAINLGGNPQVIGSFGNGYNYYGAVGAANDNFLWFQRGTITGPFKWFDSFINQVVLNSSFQAAMLTFLGTIGAVPFSNAGAGLIEQALAPVIQQFGDPAKGGFGAFAPGTISAAQISAVNNQAGANIAGTLQTQGYYLQVLQQPTNVRQNRGPWSITFFYLDRGAVQSLDLSSIAVT